MHLLSEMVFLTNADLLPSGPPNPNCTVLNVHDTVHQLNGEIMG